jgi:hypothetical protein
MFVQAEAPSPGRPAGARRRLTAQTTARRRLYRRSVASASLTLILRGGPPAKSSGRCKWRHAREPELLLPDVDEIVNAMNARGRDGWDGTRQLAGLPSRIRHVGSREGNPMVELAGRFAHEVGCLPWSRTALQEYARQKRESSADYDGGIEPINEDVQRRRAEAGLPPFAEPPGRLAPKPVIDVAPDPAPTRPRRADWRDRDTLVEGLATAFRLNGTRNPRRADLCEQPQSAGRGGLSRLARR